MIPSPSVESKDLLQAPLRARCTKPNGVVYNKQRFSRLPFLERPLFHRPTTLHDAALALAEGGQIIAGGTDFYPALGTRPAPPSLIDVSHVAEMRGIHFGPDFLRIGGATTWSEIAKAALPRSFNALRAAAREVGAVQVQNRGTIAGNLCNASPAADGVPPLLILDAQVELVSARTARRLPLRAFILGNRRTARRPDEILAAIYLPAPLSDAPSIFLKLGARRYLVISICMVAALLERDAAGRVSRARIAVGSCSAAAQRLTDLERELVGRPATRDLAAIATATHLGPLSPIDDVRATAVYRNDAAVTLVQRALTACVEAAA
jgi:CO/xanthine dehydrogenase FAD-binding subunit